MYCIEEKTLQETGAFCHFTDSASDQGVHQARSDNASFYGQKANYKRPSSHLEAQNDNISNSPASMSELQRVDTESSASRRVQR